jgi:hypothetical protein
MKSPDSQLLSGSVIEIAAYFSALVALWLLVKAVQALYNLSPLHPLSRIPGPKLAAATYLPEFYYDVWKFGGYTKEISKLHEKYGEYTENIKDTLEHQLIWACSLGPIVRINPSEVHCNDISFVDEIYAVGGRKRDKPVHQINGSA